MVLLLPLLAIIPLAACEDTVVKALGPGNKEQVKLGNLRAKYDVILMAEQNMSKQTVLAAPAAKPVATKKAEKPAPAAKPAPVAKTDTAPAASPCIRRSNASPASGPASRRKTARRSLPIC